MDEVSRRLRCCDARCPEYFSVIAELLALVSPLLVPAKVPDDVFSRT